MKPSPFKPSRLTAKQLLEIDACTRCGECTHYCPVYLQRTEEGINPRGKIQAMKKFLRAQYGLWARLLGPRKLDEETLKKFSEMVYRCTLCGECALECPVSIDTKSLWLAMREVLVEMGQAPEGMETLKSNVLTRYNITGQDNRGRMDWLEGLGDLPDHKYHKERAEVVYYVGCVSSYYPMAHKIPQTFIKILDRAGVDFTLLGGAEWCCGFPLIGAGLKSEIEGLIRHNIEGVKAKGARSVIFSCPSCYHTWRKEYRAEVDLFDSTRFLVELIRQGKIRFRQEKIRVTYHDPCDLGRSSGIYDPPREILRALPGVEFVELPDHREHCKCCGGGGNLEMIDPELSAALAKEKIKQIQSTGADFVVTACQQCIRTIMTTARRMKIPVKALYITELVLKHMD